MTARRAVVRVPVTICLLALLMPAQDPAWTVVRSPRAPGVRTDGTVVWTSAGLAVWGGVRDRQDGSSRYLGDGALFDPASRRWRALPARNAPAPRAWHCSAWTGKELIVWGGQDERERADGAAWHPGRNSWTPLPKEGAPAGRVEASCVWTGSEVVIWSGVTEEVSFLSGGRYAPGARLWRSMAKAPLPVGRRSHGAAWTGSEMLVWGGINGGRVLGDGLAWDGGGGRWTPLPRAGAPSARGYPGTAWTGERLVVFGGRLDLWGSRPAPGGAAYDPSSRRWSPLPEAGAPSARHGHVMIWTGSSLLVFGGSGTDARRTGGWKADGAALAFTGKEPRWKTLPRAPLALAHPRGAWTPHGLVVVGAHGSHPGRLVVMMLPRRG